MKFYPIREKINKWSGKRGFKISVWVMKIVSIILIVLITIAIAVFLYLLLADIQYDENQDEFNENGEVFE